MYNYVHLPALLFTSRVTRIIGPLHLIDRHVGEFRPIAAEAAARAHKLAVLLRRRVRVSPPGGQEVADVGVLPRRED